MVAAAIEEAEEEEAEAEAARQELEMAKAELKKQERTYQRKQGVGAVKPSDEKALKKAKLKVAQVRKTPSWPRSWVNFSLLSLYSHRNAWANLHLLGQPDAFLAARRRKSSRRRRKRHWPQGRSASWPASPRSITPRLSGQSGSLPVFYENPYTVCWILKGSGVLI